MKLVKRIGAFVLTLIMLNVLFAGTVFAATPSINPSITKGTLTINKPGATFTIYKIYSMTLPTGAGSYQYDATGTGFKSYLDSNNITAEAVSTYTTAAQTDPFIAGLQGCVTTNKIAGISATADATTGNAVFSDLALGYYLVVESGTDSTKASVASKAFLVSVPSVTKDGSSWNYNVVATPKDSKATITKVIEKNGDVTAATQNIGDTVNYKLQADVTTYDASATGIKYFITDTMSKGLTFEPTSVVVTGDTTTLTPKTDYTVTNSTDATTGITTIKIDFVYNNIKSYSKIIVKYSGKLNEKANIGGSGNPNSVALSYTSNPSTGSIYEDKNHTTIVYTTGIAINKEDDTPNRNDLAGAVFELRDSSNKVLAVYTYNADGSARVLSSNGLSTSTGADGMTYFIGLNEGTYYINETTAPAGYSLLPEPIKVTITASKDAVSSQYNGQFTYQYALSSETPTKTYDTKNTSDVKTVGSDIFIQVNISDHAGFTLPGTGGMGTTIFMIAGISIIVFGAVLLLIYNIRRKSNTDIK